MIAAMPRGATSATTLLIAANLLAFAFELSLAGSHLLVGGGTLSGLIRAGALVPALVLRQQEYWRVVTGAFLHGSLMHLAVNMYSLWVIGRFVEMVAGTTRMVVIYACSLLISGLAIVYLGPSFDVTVGASGAIFGLFGALFAIGFKLGKPGMRLVRANLGILVINLVLTFAVPGISTLGHVGGLVGGFVVASLVYAPPARRLRPDSPGPQSPSFPPGG